MVTIIPRFQSNKKKNDMEDKIKRRQRKTVIVMKVELRLLSEIVYTIMYRNILIDYRNVTKKNV